MNNAEKLEVLEEILYQAAEQVGDLAPVVLKRFYEAFPDGVELFKHHGGQNRQRMENDMVESSLYCIMSWFERPVEIEIMFSHTIPHHEMLKISLEHFTGFLLQTLNVIEETLPADNETQNAVWNELKSQLLKLAEESSMASLGV